MGKRMYKTPKVGGVEGSVFKPQKFKPQKARAQRNLFDKMFGKALGAFKKYNILE